MDIQLNKEQYDGNIEYKYKLINLDTDKFNRRLTQMHYRLNEGGGEAFYHIGRSDDGTPLGLNEQEYTESVENLTKLATSANCKLLLINETIKNNSYMGEFLIRLTIVDNDYIDIKIGVAGNVDAGKSTTIGTLTKGILDDGRGKARVHVFNYKHEIISGRTSSIGHQILGFNINGQIINTRFDRQPSWEEILKQSAKIISFYDLAGHEKYLKTTIYGLTSINPDYCMIMIGANMGINQMTREHIMLCLILDIQMIICISKIDIAPENILEETIHKLNNLIKTFAKKQPFYIRTSSDIITSIQNIKNNNIIPIIQLSNVSSIGLDLLKKLLNLLPIRINYNIYRDKPVEFLIDSTYKVFGHSTIVSGLLKSGTINIDDVLTIGPFNDMTYRQIKIRSIHINCKNVLVAYSGSYICLSLRNIVRTEIKKGMVIVNNLPENHIAKKDFSALIHILHSPTTIKINYQPFVHIEHIRQVVKLTKIEKINNQQSQTQTQTESEDNNILRTGDRAIVNFSFLFRAEYIKPDMKLIFREGKVKAIGKIIN